MKISNRARAALASAGYSETNNPAIAQLTAYAAQNPGLDAANYGFDRQGRSAFATEGRTISKAWRDYKAALIEAAADGVTDEDVIAEAPRAFSGRFEWVLRDQNAAQSKCPECNAKPGDLHNASCNSGSHRPVGEWNYCTGQYWPTEYRTAARVLIESAMMRVRQNRPKAQRTPKSIAELEELNRQNGGYWFSRDSMRFFGTRIESGVIRGRYFITSEQPPHGSRKYSVRSFDAQGSVDTVGDFCSFRSKADAIAAIPRNEEATTI